MLQRGLTLDRIVVGLLRLFVFFCRILSAESAHGFLGM